MQSVSDNNNNNDNQIGQQSQVSPLFGRRLPQQRDNGRTGAAGGAANGGAVAFACQVAGKLNNTRDWRAYDANRAEAATPIQSAAAVAAGQFT